MKVRMCVTRQTQKRVHRYDLGHSYNRNELSPVRKYWRMRVNVCVHVLMCFSWIVNEWMPPDEQILHTCEFCILGYAVALNVYQSLQPLHRWHCQHLIRRWVSILQQPRQSTARRAADMTLCAFRIECMCESRTCASYLCKAPLQNGRDITLWKHFARFDGISRHE